MILQTLLSGRILGLTPTYLSYNFFLHSSDTTALTISIVFIVVNIIVVLDIPIVIILT